MKVNIGNYPKKGERKIHIKIDNYDTWSLDSTLALIIFPALLQIKETKLGVPSEFVNDVADDYNEQMTFDFMQEDKDDVFQMGVQKWEDVLDKIIWSFQQLAIGDYDSQYSHGDAIFDSVPSEHVFVDPVTGTSEPTHELVDKNPDDHWYDIVGVRTHEERIQEGLELFGKHFRNLWV